MNYIQKIMAKQAIVFKQLATDLARYPAGNIDNTTETLETVSNVLTDDDIAKVTTNRPDCARGCSNKENFAFDTEKIAGMDLATFVYRFPRIQYVVGQILDFIYKEKLVITHVDSEQNELKTEALQSTLNLKDNTGITNHRKLMEATKEALIYGRAGLLRRSDARFELYPHDRYTVVLGLRKSTQTVQSEVLGYIIYTEDTAPKQAVIDLKNLEDMDANSLTHTNEWLLEAIDRKTQITNCDDKMLYVPAELQKFVNLRYDTHVQNPKSRLFYSQLEIENSAYFREAMSRKFLEKGLGRLVVQLKDDVSSVSGDTSLDVLINQNRESKKSMLQAVQKFTQTFANSLRNLRDDDFLVSPSNIEKIDRLENTNQPNLFMKLLELDDSILPACYGVPASLLGLGTLSDRNISIATVNETAEDTTVRTIRDGFMSQLGMLFHIDDTETLTSEKIVDTDTQQKTAKTAAEVVALLAKAGLADKAKSYAEENIPT